MAELSEDHWELIRTTVSYNMASSSWLALDITRCGGGLWEVKRLPFNSDLGEDDVDEGVPDFSNGISTGCLEPLELYREVGDTLGYSESYYGFMDPGEFLDALRGHGARQLAELADEIEAALAAEEDGAG